MGELLGKASEKFIELFLTDGVTPGAEDGHGFVAGSDFPARPRACTG